MGSPPKNTPSTPTIQPQSPDAANALRRLTQPSASIPVLDRHRAHLLAWLLLVLILLTLSDLILALLANPAGSPRRGEYMTLILLLALLFSIAYGLLRAGYYQQAAALTVLCAVCGPWGSLVVDPTVLEGDFVPLTYVVISIILSSILMHPLITSVLAGLQLIALLWIASFDSASSINWPSLLVMVFFTSVLSILANVINQRDLKQIDQQTRELELNTARQTQLLEEALRRIKQMTVLQQVATAATQLDSVDRLIESMTDIISKNLFPDTCGVLLLDEKQDLLRPHPSYHSRFDRHLALQDIPLGRGITGQVAQTGQTMRIGRIEGIQNYVDIDRGTSSELCVPIKHKNKVLGVINVESIKPEAFSADDEQLLGTLASQLATAIEQLRATDAEHRWLGQLAHSNELIRALSNIAAHLQKALNQQEIIQTLGNDLKTMGLTCAVAMNQQDKVMANFAQQVASALKRAELFQEIQSLALTDPLTGLQNRRSLFELGRIEFARSIRMERQFCCLMLDLDHFKTINDRYGHPIGDLVLQEFARGCKRSIRAADLIGRYGGEELVIFLPETDLDTAVQVAERLRESVEKMPIKIPGQELHITVSIGVSRRPCWCT